MSGLLVKSTVVMRENLEELNLRGMAGTLPGAARRRRAHPRLRRAGPRRDLPRRGALRPRRVRGAAADGRGDGRQARRCRAPRCPSRASARVDGGARRRSAETPLDQMPPVPTWRPTTPCPTPPFWGTRVVKGIALADYAAYLDERATFIGQWGLKPARGDGPSYEELVETEGRPRLRMWLDRIQTEGMIEAAVVYGYFPCVSEGDDLVVLHEGGWRARSGPVHLPAPAPRPAPVPVGLLPAEGRRGETDVIALPRSSRWATAVSEVTAELFAGQRLPRLPRAARAVRAADRGARRVLARADPQRARLRLRRTTTTWTSSSASRATAAPGTPSATPPAPTSRTGPARRPARARADRGRALRGVPAPPRAVHVALIVHHPEAKYFNAT